jgi:hypothetical protein
MLKMSSELPSTNGQEINDHLVEILTQSALDEADEPEPKEKSMTGTILTEGLGVTEAGIKVFENIDWNGQLAAATGREVRGCLLAVRRF